MPSGAEKSATNSNPIDLSAARSCRLSASAFIWFFFRISNETGRRRRVSVCARIRMTGWCSGLDLRL